MLVATYALVTLTVEQRCERSHIQVVQQALAAARDPALFDAARLALALEKLVAIAEATHWRRLEYCLIPAIRAAAGDSAGGMRAIEMLGRDGKQMVPLIRTSLRRPVRLSPSQVTGACGQLQQYCQNLLARLACEEEQIVPLAQRLLDSEAWLRVGLGFLDQDTQDRPQESVSGSADAPGSGRSAYRETPPGPASPLPSDAPA